MQIKLTITGATDRELRTVLAAHSQLVEYEVLGPQPINYGGKRDGRAHVGCDGPEKFSIETFKLTPDGVRHILEQLTK